MRIVRDNDPDFETLSAYVDGELDAESAARIARLIAADERIARRVAKLHEMHAAVGSLVPDVVLLPRIPEALARQRARPAARGRLVAAAAAMIVAAGIGGLLWEMHGRLSPGEGNGGAFLERVIERHDGWAKSSAEGIGEATLPGELEGPVLMRAGLLLAYRDSWQDGQGRSIVHTGYVGPRGCKLSLFEVSPLNRVARPDAPLEIAVSEALLKARWHVREADYVLVARQMDEGRFALLASVLKETTETRSAPAPDRVAQLDAARQPCFS